MAHIKLSMFDPTPTAVNAGAVLNGYAVSTGRVCPTASVIRSIEDFNQMKPGTILVLRRRPDLDHPLFSQAVGAEADPDGRRAGPVPVAGSTASPR